MAEIKPVDSLVPRDPFFTNQVQKAAARILKQFGGSGPGQQTVWGPNKVAVITSDSTGRRQVHIIRGEGKQVSIEEWTDPELPKEDFPQLGK